MVVVRQQVATEEFWSEADAVQANRDRFASLSAARRAGGDAQRQMLLKRTVETEIIPRLLLARRVALPVLREVLPDQAEHVQSLVGLVLAQDLGIAETYVDGLREAGRLPEQLYLDLLAPAARQLGDMWLEDKCDFTEVTVGLWRLGQVLRGLSPSFLGNAELMVAGPRALLVPIPGEQHTFGLAMVVDFFRRAGWSVWSGAVSNAAELAGLVRGQPFALIGFSVACSDRMEQVASAIRTVRRATCNHNAGVMVGGPAFVANPDLAAAVGADATAIDGAQAVQQASTLLNFLSAQR